MPLPSLSVWTSYDSNTMAAFINVWMASNKRQRRCAIIQTVYLQPQIASMITFRARSRFTFLKHSRAIAYQSTAFRIWYAWRLTVQVPYNCIALCKACTWQAWAYNPSMTSLSCFNSLCKDCLTRDVRLHFHHTIGFFGLNHVSADLYFSAAEWCHSSETFC